LKIERIFLFHHKSAAEDFSSTYVQIPEHTVFYTVGGAQTFEINRQRGFLLRLELSNLEVSRSQNLIRDSDIVANYYYHHKVIHGYTNNGQILGAGIGPGSDSQFFSITYYDTWGSVEMYLFRQNKDKTFVYNDTSTYSQNNLNAEICFGLKGLIFLGPIDLSTEIVFINERSNLYIEDNDFIQFHGELGLRYRYK